MTDRINNTNGFTFVEAMIVMVLIAIISVIALPAWHSMKRNSDLKGAAYEVMGTIQLAKSEAARRNACIGIALNPAACPPGQGDCYEIFLDDDTAGGVDCDHNLTDAERPAKVLRSGSLGTRAKISVPSNYRNGFAVTPRGLVRVGSGGLPNGTVTLRAETNHCYRLVISPTAGLRLEHGQWDGAACQ
jgi:type IV fimbrial biogenesis protein FimT